MRVGKSLVAWFVVLAGVGNWARGTVIQYPLTEFLGDYSYSDLSSFGVEKRITVDTGLSPWGVRSARVVLKGTVQPGLVCGDGVTVPAGDVVLKGGFSIGYIVARSATFAGPPLVVKGSFSREEALNPPFGDILLEGDLTKPPQRFNPSIWISCGVNNFAMDLPRPLVDPPSGPPFEFRLWSDGYSLITPLTGSITEAYLLVDTVEVPEPGALGALALGGLAMLRRVRRS